MHNESEERGGEEEKVRGKSEKCSEKRSVVSSMPSTEPAVASPAAAVLEKRRSRESFKSFEGLNAIR